DILLDHSLDERRLEVVVDDHDTIDLFGRVQLGQPMGYRLSVLVGGPVGEACPRPVDLVAAEGERRAPLAADDEPAHLLPLRAETAVERERVSEHLRVEGAGEAAVTGE